MFGLSLSTYQHSQLPEATQEASNKSEAPSQAGQRLDSQLAKEPHSLPQGGNTQVKFMHEQIADYNGPWAS